jgi:threonine dehydrogenase-like Zn-dependent dehydrogenase
MTATMWAARGYRGASSLKLEQVEVPRLDPGEVLVKVAAAGIAPGMMKLLEMGRFKHLPTTPGHEIAGEVVALGQDVDRSWLNTRIRVHPMLSCGHCHYCLSDREQMCNESAMIGHAAFGRGPLEAYAKYHDGGLAQFVKAPWNLLDRLPDSVSFDVGAKVHDFANAVRALKNAALPATGRLAITAATGTMGTASIKLAEFYGARELVLIARSRRRLDALLPLTGGMPTTLIADDWARTGELTARLREQIPQGLDAVLDYFPDGPGSQQVAGAMALGGSFVHMGGNSALVPFALREMMINCWRFIGTRACTRSDTSEVLDLLGRGELKVEELITHRFSLDEVNGALDATRSRDQAIWMAVVKP